MMAVGEFSGMERVYDLGESEFLMCCVFLMIRLRSVGWRYVGSIVFVGFLAVLLCI